MYFWSIVGDDNTQAHAAQLLAHTYATLKRPSTGAQYLEGAHRSWEMQLMKYSVVCWAAVLRRLSGTEPKE